MALWGGVLLTSPAAVTGAQWTVRGNVDPHKFIIQGHRGAGDLAPENTIQAFELGWKLGTTPEADIRTTKDGVIVAFHDANFKRVVKGASPDLQKKGVVDITYEELSRTWGVGKGSGLQEGVFRRSVRCLM